MTNENKQVLIQKQIDDAMAKEFENLMLAKKEDILLQLLLSGKLDTMSVEELKELLDKEGVK